jgi:hypothetical protein
MSTIDPPSSVEPGNFLARLLIMAVYLAILFVVRFALWAVLVVQVLFHLVAGRPSGGARKVGQAVAEYIYRIWLYLSYATNEKPFPFGGRKS